NKDSDLVTERRRVRRPFTPLTKSLTFYHDSNSGVDGHQPGKGASLVPSRNSSFILWATEVPMDHQVCDGPSWQPSPRLRFPCRLFHCDGK
ncbi:hypothetical protein HAX54_047132, partial [Datura stramonium]|nr:hypothetical protein [Datura stramonium]